MAAAKSGTRARTNQRGTSWRAQQAHRRKVRLWSRVAIVAAAVGALAAITTVIVVSGSGSKASPSRVADVQLQLGDYFITGDLEAPAGDVVLDAVNVGVQPHNVGIRGGPITTNLDPGKRARLDLGVLAPGRYQLYCDIGDHVARGMVATLVVTPPVDSTTSSTAAG